MGDPATVTASGPRFTLSGDFFEVEPLADRNSDDPTSAQRPDGPSANVGFGVATDSFSVSCGFGPYYQNTHTNRLNVEGSPIDCTNIAVTLHPSDIFGIETGLLPGGSGAPFEGGPGAQLYSPLVYDVEWKLLGARLVLNLPHEIAVTMPVTRAPDDTDGYTFGLRVAKKKGDVTQVKISALWSGLRPEGEDGRSRFFAEGYGALQLGRVSLALYTLLVSQRIAEGPREGEQVSRVFGADGYLGVAISEIDSEVGARTGCRNEDTSEGEETNCGVSLGMKWMVLPEVGLGADVDWRGNNVGRLLFSLSYEEEFTSATAEDLAAVNAKVEAMNKPD
jgi:hypothetical protein